MSVVKGRRKQEGQRGEQGMGHRTAYNTVEEFVNEEQCDHQKFRAGKRC